MVQVAATEDGDVRLAIWDDLLQRIEVKRATIGVIGMGYVGLPLAVAFARKGFSVIGFDVVEQKIAELAAGRSYILDVPASALRSVMDAGTFLATSHAKELEATDAMIICVPTPCQRNRTPDLSYIEHAAETVAQVLRPGQLVILESTTYPGTTEEVLAPRLSRTGLRLYEDFLVAFSPERIDPGNEHYHVENTPKVVGGLGSTATELVYTLYSSVIERVVKVDSPREAEMAKLIENTFRHVNIALANELGLIARKMGVNIWQAIDAAASKPFGYMPFYPGPGVGGHCIPIDPHYLSWKAREIGCETTFIELAERINHAMPEHVVRMVIDAVNQSGKPIRGAHILLLGLAYKRDIDDLRESPALPIFDMLETHGAEVSYHDPFVPSFNSCKGRQRHSSPLTRETLAACDCAVLITDHTCFDRDIIAQSAPVIVDTRNWLKDYPGEHIVRL